MAQVRRAGDKDSLWGNVVTGAAGVSTAIEIPRGAESLAVYITVSAATTVKLQVAHGGDYSAEGILSDTADTVWHDVYYAGTLQQIVFAAGGSAVLMVPDWVSGWIRLVSSASVTATAGWETTGG